MNENNSQFDKTSFGIHQQSAQNGTYRQSQGNTYEYVFSSGKPYSSAPMPRKPKRNGTNVFALAVTVILCVTLSFMAAFGGAVLGNRLFAEENQITNPAPADDSLYSDDAKDLINKSESDPSQYGSAGEDVLSVSQVAQKVQDSVVVIDVSVSAGSSIFGSQTTTGSGSGVIISDQGYILTCNHVVEDALSIQVTLNSGSKYQAALVGSDANSDLAVIKITPNDSEPLVYAEQGKSDNLVVGERVVAIGNPLGTLGGTVTDGIISAKERTITMSDGTVMTLLQTNAAINSGNSGGGLFNLDGQLVGIVNAKYAAEGVEGLAFAIPIDRAYEVQLELIEYGYVRGIVDHGLTLVDVTESNLYYYYFNFKIDTVGVYVASSEYNTDLQNKDRIVSVNGVAVKSEAEFEAAISSLKVGDSITVVYSHNGTQKTTTLVLREYVPDYVKDKTE